MSGAPTVKNATDTRQVHHAARKDKDRRKRDLAAWRAVLGTPEGRLVLWNMLEHCQVFTSIWHPSALIHHASGKQDVGHFLMAEITEADEDRLFLMMKEASQRKRSDAVEAEAVRTTSATDKPEAST
jgi:hypothetical protein